MAIDNYLLAAIAAFTLDSVIGDPYWMPHPIRLFGNAIAFFERLLNKGAQRRLKGGVMWLILVGGTYAIFALINTLLLPYSAAWSLFIYISIFWGISTRCLINEGIKVERFLQRDDIQGARNQLSMIVGRDTSHLTPAQIRAAVIETLSENLSDGTIAPLFYLAIGGVPLMMCYKMVNTLDSMVGYKNDRYHKFGYVSAKADDVANFIPARLTAIMMAIVSLSPRCLKFIFKYGNKHSSPNAGYPEAAIAGVLNCRLGGESVYFGKVVSKPYIGEQSRELYHKDFITCCAVNAKVAIFAYIIVALIITTL